ncbi:MAG: cation diffusion facilitator family transporter [Elusimicrobiales bacterium]|nr:cation diffusion facilitator family transporter [Elusimicrobiales bacterium]
MHEHSGHHHHDRRETPRGRALKITFAITAAFMAVELAGGLLTGSLALVSDAAHMLTDAAALGLSLFAFSMSAKKGSAEKTFGYHRAEVLSALANGITLWLICGFIIREAWDRFHSSSDIAAGPMLAVAAAGLAANIACAWILHGEHERSINVRGAFLHVLTDLLGSVAVIAAALIIMFTGWKAADPLLSLAIVALTLWSSWGLVRDSVHILMEGAPAHIDREEVRKALAAIPGVRGVHELHLWTLTSGREALSAHLLVENTAESDRILGEADCALGRNFNISHTTLQIETEKRENSCDSEHCCGI